MSTKPTDTHYSDVKILYDQFKSLKEEMHDRTTPNRTKGELIILRDRLISLEIRRKQIADKTSIWDTRSITLLTPQAGKLPVWINRCKRWISNKEDVKLNAPKSETQQKAPVDSSTMREMNQVSSRIDGKKIQSQSKFDSIERFHATVRVKQSETTPKPSIAIVFSQQQATASNENAAVVKPVSPVEVKPAQPTQIPVAVKQVVAPVATILSQQQATAFNENTVAVKPVSSVEVKPIQSTQIPPVVKQVATPVAISNENTVKPMSPVQVKPAQPAQTPTAVKQVVAPVAVAPAQSNVFTNELKINFQPGKNALFIRGEGPGMNWNTGKRLENVGGKWTFTTSAPVTAPFPFKVLLNDTQWEQGENHTYVKGIEITPRF